MAGLIDNISIRPRNVNMHKHNRQAVFQTQTAMLSSSPS